MRENLPDPDARRKRKADGHALEAVAATGFSGWWSRQESNLDLRLRRPSSYPLDHGTGRSARPERLAIRGTSDWQGEAWGGKTKSRDAAAGGRGRGSLPVAAGHLRIAWAFRTF